MADDTKDPRGQDQEPQKVDQGTPEDQGGKGDDKGADKKDQDSGSRDFDLERVRNQVKTEVLSQVSGRLKKLFGVESLDELEEQHLKKKGEFEELFQKEKERAERWKRRFEEALIRQKVKETALELGAIDASLILDLVRKDAEVVEDQVKVAGKEVTDAIKELLEGKPFLKKATGKEGGGASSAGAGGGENEKERLLADYEKAKERGDVMALLRLKAKMAQLS